MTATPAGDPQWLIWARTLQAIGQTGLTYCTDPYDRERYDQITTLANEIMSTYSDASPDQLRALFATEQGHATPKVDVRGVVFRDDTILLVRERQDGHWTLPGGWADIGEPPSQAVAREVYEESGYRTRAIKLLALYDRSRHAHPPLPFYVYKLFFLCELLNDVPDDHMSDPQSVKQSHLETDGIGFFSENALPELSLGRVLPTQISRFFDLYRQPGSPTDFD